MPKFHTATLLTKTLIADKFYILDFYTEVPLSFLPGQYLIVRVNPTRVVQYSLTSLPRQTTFQLLVEYIPGGQASQWIKHQLQIGDTIEYLGPMGIFTLQDQPAEQLLFLATGAGIAPFKSMINHLLINQKATLPIHLYFGLRTTNELVYHDHFNQLELDYPNFHFHLCISQPGTTWTGKKGRITYHVQQDLPNTSGFSVYICGSESMIQETIPILTNSGTDLSQVHHEKFW